jgi:Group II intron, maturase-specific domain
MIASRRSRLAETEIAALASSTTGSRPANSPPAAAPATGSASPGRSRSNPNAVAASPNPGRLWLPVEEVVKDLNRFLRGWAAYFRYGHCADRFRKIEQHARDRLAVFIGKRHKRGHGFGWSVLAYTSTDFCGLLSLNGTVIAPRADKPWREKPNAAGERRR